MLGHLLYSRQLGLDPRPVRMRPGPHGGRTLAVLMTKLSRWADAALRRMRPR